MVGPPQPLQALDAKGLGVQSGFLTGGARRWVCPHFHGWGGLKSPPPRKTQLDDTSAIPLCLGGQQQSSLGDCGLVKPGLCWARPWGVPVTKPVPAARWKGPVVPVPVYPALHSCRLSGFSIGPWGWTGYGAFPACCPCEQASAHPSCCWDSPPPASPRVQSWHWPTPARPLPPT